MCKILLFLLLLDVLISIDFTTYFCSIYLNMKDLIRNILQEETSQEKLAKGYLSRLKLTPWKNDKYDLIFFATQKGTCVFLIVTDDFEISIQDSTYDVLMKLLKTEDKVMNFLYDYVTERGIKLPFHKSDTWISRSENVGGVDEDDEPYFDSNNLNESSNPVKNYWFKKWTRQKEKGETPSIYDIEKLGLSKKRNEIIQYFLEFMGYDGINSRSDAVKQYLLNHTFTENEITDMKYLDEGKIKIKFTKVEFVENDNVSINAIDLDIEFEVLSGSFYNSDEEETYNFSSNENHFDDFVSYWDFKDEINNFVMNFVGTILESFGFNINNDFDYITVDWE